MLLLVGWLSTVLFAVRPSVWTSLVIVGGLVSCGLLICCLSVCFSLLLVGWLVGCWLSGLRYGLLCWHQLLLLVGWLVVGCYLDACQVCFSLLSVSWLVGCWRCVLMCRHPAPDCSPSPNRLLSLLQSLRPTIVLIFISYFNIYCNTLLMQFQFLRIAQKYFRIRKSKWKPLFAPDR